MREGEIVPLKPKAFDTLLALVEHCGHVVEKDELMRRVWPDTVVEEGNLTFNVSSLRKALGDDPRRHQYIVTIPGEGYQFVAGVHSTFDELVVHESTSITVEEEGAERASLASAPVEPALLGQRNEQLSFNPQSAIRTPQYWLAGALVLITVTVIGIGIFWLVNKARSTGNTIAAAPFRE